MCDFKKTAPFTDAVWIAADKNCSSPVISRRFNAAEIKKATLTVTGLGYFEAHVNGLPVTDKKFIPAVSCYEPRDLSKFTFPLRDVLTHRIYYYEFDITRLLKRGENCLSVQLGNGFYRQKERTAEGITDFSDILKTIYKITLETENGTEYICSDGSEHWHESEITYNNLYVGEIIDPAAADKTEKKVSVLEFTDTVFSPAMGTDDRVISEIKPALLGKVNGKKIYDAGVNISGTVRVKTRAPRGEKIILCFAENINADLTLNPASTGAGHTILTGEPQLAHDVFICDGSERYFEPKFIWHGFRYFEVDGDIEDATVLVIHSDTPVTATFESSFEGLNFLFDSFIRTQLNNMHGSIPSDCPHRERLGYTGDGQACAEAVMLTLDSREFYRKWIRDIFDSQDSVGGHIQHTAPLFGGGGGPGGWGCAAIIVPYKFYKRFGDTDLLREYYQNMRLWLQYLFSHSENGLVVREEEGGWCLGDWCTLEETVLPEPFVNSCYLVKSLQMMCEIAAAIGKESDVEEYRSSAERVCEAITREYFDTASKEYCGGVQGADAYAVWIGLAGADTAKRLAEKYDSLGHFDTGFLGTDILLEVLSDYGFTDTVFKLLQSEELGSFLYMKRHGATTIWESWGGGNSHDHPMFGGCTRQLFSSVLGIKQDKAGYNSLIIEPHIPSLDGFARGSIEISAGKVSVEWEKAQNETNISIALPEGVEAVFRHGNTQRQLSAGENRFSLNALAKEGL